MRDVGKWAVLLSTIEGVAMMTGRIPTITLMSARYQVVRALMLLYALWLWVHIWRARL